MPHRFACIHGHFYQPPRENPWTETIDYQDSAAPYHDWNYRINAECYRPNGLSRILDHDGWVVKLSNNYSKISFNFGPTLLSWIERHDPHGYASIIEGDKISQSRYGGHGSALAQAYNHTILPLSNRRDKETQIKWGLYDFEERFGREAEGMWIPETAVDLESLEILADHGLKFVLLAPRQAQAVRQIEENAIWESVRGERINTRMPYAIQLPGGKSIAAFFYDGPTSRAVAFEGLLNNGEIFASRLCSDYEPSLGRAQLAHIATDGESYGHHHAKGDMALAYALEYIERTGMAKLTNYGQFLELSPPTHEAMLYERSSWSCIHGIERWTSDCGCSSGGHADWNQKWRRPLREAFDYLQKRLAPIYEDSCRNLVSDPWGMRDDYIRLVLDRGNAAQNAFFSKWMIARPEDQDAKITLLQALEMQRHAMLMYTSCAWFFDEISGIETVQALAYAARAIDLAQTLSSEKVEEDFLRILAQAPSNIPELANGRQAYERYAASMRMDFSRIAAHYTALSLFDHIDTGDFFCCDVQWNIRDLRSSDKVRLLYGVLNLRSKITREEREFLVVAFNAQDYNVNIGVLDFSGRSEIEDVRLAFSSAFESGKTGTIADALLKYFPGNIYYLDDLMHEHQKSIIDRLLVKTLESIETEFSDIYHRNHSVMNYLTSLNIHMPQVFSDLGHFVQNQQVKRALSENDPDIEMIESYIAEALRLNIALDERDIERRYIDALKRAFRICKEKPNDSLSLEKFLRLLLIKDRFSFTVDLGEVQNSFAVWNHNNKSQDSAVRDTISEILKIRVQK